MSNIETVNGNWYISTRTMDEILQKQTPDELQPFKELMRLPDSELVALLGDSADDLVDFRLGFTVLIEESLLTVNEKEVKSKMFDIDTNDFVHDRGILVQDNHNPLLTSLKLQWDQGTLDRLNLVEDGSLHLIKETTTYYFCRQKTTFQEWVVDSIS